ncbi:hypothetical protein BDW75DRAFT_32431 [Aspergillus navahoensis]
MSITSPHASKTSPCLPLCGWLASGHSLPTGVFGSHIVPCYLARRWVLQGLHRGHWALELKNITCPLCLSLIIMKTSASHSRQYSKNSRRRLFLRRACFWRINLRLLEWRVRMVFCSSAIVHRSGFFHWGLRTREDIWGSNNPEERRCGSIISQNRT